jgi:hypothetical protein
MNYYIFVFIQHVPCLHDLRSDLGGLDIGTEHYLAKSEKLEHMPGHRARIRTLLPLMCKALMIVLTVMIVMILLSEFGVTSVPC